MKTVTGDLIKLAQEGRFDVIVQGCNCHCRMGSGLAKQIKEAYPGAYEVDQETDKGDKTKLGTVSIWMNSDIAVVNAYTQYDYGYDGKQYVDYEAVRKCMKSIKGNFSGKKIGLPLIGCGLAGGDWTTVLHIIRNELKDEDFTIVRYDKGE